MYNNIYLCSFINNKNCILNIVINNYIILISNIMEYVLNLFFWETLKFIRFWYVLQVLVVGKRRKIIVDCDPGQDDAVALLMAFQSPTEIDFAGVTCVAGNVDLKNTLRNALRVRELAKRLDVPVFGGCPRPLIRPLKTAEEVHGLSGLDGVDLPEPTVAADPRHGVSFIIDTCRSAVDGEITLCLIGPMTNLALALVMAPDITVKIREIAFMGGTALGAGNVTPAAEFNIYVDPHATQIVFESGISLTMFGLDVTHKAIATPSRRAQIQAIGTPVAQAVAQMLTYYDRIDLERYGEPGSPLHDPCVIAYLLNASLFHGRECHIAVDTSPGPAFGRTIVDWWGKSDKPTNCRVISEIDVDGFFVLLRDCLVKAT